jgi:hypothetical protein
MDSAFSAVVPGRSAIVEQWLTALAGTYPAGASPLLGKADEFRNPVRHVIEKNVAALVDAVVFGDDWVRATSAMAEIAQLRVVQGFRAEDALAVVEPLRAIAGACTPDLDARLDRLTTLAVELYAACRARIDQIASREARRRTWLLERLRDSGGQ